ncbi:MAG: dTDP-glucose 4,6-dehydratase [Chloroflexota bacterium]|nr:dTDP-glucose 4,6-dehydratase [Chloroflexota bacterium]
MSTDQTLKNPLQVLLVTGGCGFIGSNFIRTLLSRYTAATVINVDKLTYAGNPTNTLDLESTFGERYIFVKGDITDKHLLTSIFERTHTAFETLPKTESITSIVNFAAESHVDRSILDSSPFIKTNVSGTQILLDISREYNVTKFLQVSTDEVYGDASPDKNFDESSSLLPSSPYAASKAAADLLVLSYFRTYSLPVVLTRSSNNFGPYQFPEKLIPLMISKAISGQNLPIYGNGKQSRDWLYVRDNCDALIRVLTEGEDGNIYNISGNQELSNIDMVHTICQLISDKTGIPLKHYSDLIKYVEDRPGHDIRYSCVSNKILAKMGWQPSGNFLQNLEYTVDWYLSNQSWVQAAIDRDYEAYYRQVYDSYGGYH